MMGDDDDDDDCVSVHHHCELRERYESGRIGSNKGKIDINQDQTGCFELIKCM